MHRGVNQLAFFIRDDAKETVLSLVKFHPRGFDRCVEREVRDDLAVGAPDALAHVKACYV